MSASSAAVLVYQANSFAIQHDERKPRAWGSLRGPYPRNGSPVEREHRVDRITDRVTNLAAVNLNLAAWLRLRGWMEVWRWGRYELSFVRVPSRSHHLGPYLSC